MTNLTILLMFLLFSTNVHCKFKIQITRALVSKQNTDYVNGSFWLSKISGYINGLDGVIDLHQEVKLRAFEFLHNEYRPFAINLEQEICSFFELEYKTFFYLDFVKIGARMPEPKCSIRRGVYAFANFTINERNYPTTTTLPFNKAMMEVAFWYQNEATLVIQVYATFDRDVILREKYA